MAAFLHFGCGSPSIQNENDAVARAFDRTLERNDLLGIMPTGLSATDSATMANSYITNWLRQQVIIKKAEENLSEEAKNVTRQMEDYRNSLIIHAYEQQLVQQKLNTSIPDTMVANYYATHEKDLILEGNIVRAVWFKVKNEFDPNWKKLEKWFRSSDEKDLSELERWLAERQILVMGEERAWIYSVELQDLVSLEHKKFDQLVTRPGKYIEPVDGGRIFLRIFEHRGKDSTSPLEMVKDRITSILVNRRRVQLLDDMRHTLYNEAMAKKHVEIL